jgi:hypothetical protein
MASLRNLAIGILRRHGHRNIAPRCAATPTTPPQSRHRVPSQAHEPDPPYFAETLAATMVGVATAVSASRTFPGA